MELILTIKKSLIYEYSQWICLAIITFFLINWFRIKFLPTINNLNDAKIGKYTKNYKNYN